MGISELQTALANFGSPSVLLYLLLGGTIGFLVGILPGLGATVALALMLPFVFGLTPFEAMAFMLSMIAVTGITGDFTSILFGIPGEATSVALVLDGHPMSKRGEAGRALAAALVSSAFGAIIGASLLAVSLPLMRPLILALGTPEVFMLTLAGASMVGVLSTSAPLKGILIACLGFALATVGADPKTGVIRYSFGQIFLFDGIPLIPMTVGLFAIPELIDLAVNRLPISRDARLAVTGVRQGVKDAFQHWFLAVRCSIIAVLVGVVPGLGGAVSQWMAYGHALQTSRHPEAFGHGAIEGVIGPGAANNAKDGGALIPLVGFGIPGSLQGTILLGALLILGISPGPEMVRENADVTLFMILVLVLTSLIATVALLPLLGPIARITVVEGTLLVPFIALFLYVAAYSERGLLVDAVIALIFGGLGWLMERIEWSRAALLLGFVLGARSETSLWISSSIYGIDWLVRPGVIILSVLVVLIGVVAVRRRRAGQATERLLMREQMATAEVGTRSSMLDSPSTVGLAIVFAALIVLAWDWPLAARLFPTVMSLVGIACCLFLLTRLLRSWRADLSQMRRLSSLAGDQTARRGLAVIVWIVALIVAVQVLGFAVAVPLFVFAYVVVDARQRPILAAGLAVVAFVVFPVVFTNLLSMRFPEGLLW